MQDAANLRSINLGQLATATDRLLAFGRPRKHHIEREFRPMASVWAERTVIVRRRRARRPFLPAVLLAAMFGVASLIAIGVDTSHAATVHSTLQP